MAKFEKGQSGNPGGRPKAEVAVRDLARQHTEGAIMALVNALRAESESVRVSAASALLDRGWGRPAQPLTGEDGGPILIQTLLDTLDGSSRGLPR